MMTKELSEVERIIIASAARVVALKATQLDQPLWQVREVLVAAFDAEAERVE